MKKILLILFGAFCALTAQAQLALSWWGNEANGGDKMFEAYLSTLGLDKDNDGKLSSDERKSLLTLSIQDMEVVLNHEYEGSTFIKYYNPGFTTVTPYSNYTYSQFRSSNAGTFYVDVTAYVNANNITLQNGQKLKRLRGLYQFEYLTAIDVSNNSELVSIELVNEKLEPTKPTYFNCSKPTYFNCCNCINLESLVFPAIGEWQGAPVRQSFNVSNCKKLESLTIQSMYAITADSFKISGCPLKQLYMNDVSLGGTLDLRDGALEEVTITNCSFGSLLLQNNHISSLNLSNCYSLYNLNCSNNPLTSLDLSGLYYLRILNCKNCQLETLAFSTATGNELKKVYCQNNKLTALDVKANPKVEELYCFNNQIEALDVSSNPALKDLQCGFNKMETLDLSNNTDLVQVLCESNQLTSLKVGSQPTLTRLFTQENQLTSLDVSQCPELKQLDCRANQLPSIDVSANAKLNYLYCQNNHIASLDLSGNTELTRLTCQGNQLNTLDVTNNPLLWELSCDQNHLTTLDVSNLPKLEVFTCAGQTKDIDVTVLGSDRDQVGVSLIPAGWNDTNVTGLTLGGNAMTPSKTTHDSQDYLVLSNGTPAGDIDLYHQTVTYNYNPQAHASTLDEIKEVRMDVTIGTSPYVMYLHPATLNKDRQTEQTYVGTLYLDYRAYVPTEAGAKCYIATGVNSQSMDAASQLVLKQLKGDFIPANTAIIVTTTDPKYLAFYEDKRPDAYDRTYPFIDENILAGSLANVTVTPRSVLTLGHDKSTGKMGFWNFTGTTVKAHRAYVPASVVSSSALSKGGMTFLFPDQTTGIHRIGNSKSTAGTYYDIQGRKVANPRKGIYIVNGKKVIK